MKWLCACLLGVWPALIPAAGRADIVAVHGSDSAAMQAAIGRSRSGDTVRLPAGTYRITETIRPKTGTKLVGDGRSTIVLYGGSQRSVMISLEGCEDVAISDLVLDGANTGLVSEGIHAYNSRRLAIRRVTIRNLAKGSDAGVHGIHFVGDAPSKEHGVTDSAIADCTLTEIGVGAQFGCGIRFSWGSSQNQVTGCAIDHTGRGGIFGDNGSNDLVIRRNKVTRSGGESLGIEVWGGCDRCVIEDNRIDHWLSIGGCDWCAVRRNVISAKDGSFGFIGIEGIGSHCVYTDNRVDDGQVIGLSLSNTPAMRYSYYARNTFRACSQWGAQFQGETGGIAYQYLYRCRFVGTTCGRGKVIYPNDCGHGFRVNGNTHHVTFEECEFSGNAGAGFQVTTADSGAWSFVRCRFADNKGRAMTAPPLAEPLEFLSCVAKGNRSDALLPAHPFPSAPPICVIRGPLRVRASERARFIVEPRAKTSGIKEALWDFGEGPPAAGLSADHTFTTAGTHHITAIVWDLSGRAARAELTVRVVGGP